MDFFQQNLQYIVEYFMWFLSVFHIGITWRKALKFTSQKNHGDDYLKNRINSLIFSSK